jgi:hypothetical protein
MNANGNCRREGRGILVRPNKAVKKPDFQPAKAQPLDLSDFLPGIFVSSAKCAGFLTLTGSLCI